MKPKIRLLLLEDNKADAELEMIELARCGMELEYQRIDTEEEMIQALKEKQWDIIISDYVMPSFCALNALKILKKMELDIPLIVVSGTIGEDVAVEAMKAGASDYIMKGNLQRLFPAILRELKESEIRRQKKIAEEELRENEERFRQIAENIEEVIWLRSGDLKEILYISPAYEKIWGRSCQSMYENSNSFLESIHFEDKERILKAHQKFIKSKIFDQEFRIIRPDGSIRWIWARTFPILDKQGNITRISGIAEDITKRKEAQQKLEFSLKEKESLLRELYHRTKNNMQIVSSMLYLQSAYTQDDKLINAFREISTRIDSIALVHQKLYSSQNLSKINLKEYVEELFSLIFKSFGISKDQIKTHFEMEETIILIDIATPCGLVVNELITNSLKYAFPEKRKGEITFKLKKISEGTLKIEYSDNGVGFPADFDFKNTKTLGFTILNGIIKDQLRGTAEFQGNKGFSAKIQIKTNLYEERI